MSISSLFDDQAGIPRLMQKSFEWFTPLQYIKPVRAVLGGIELDPASCAQANLVVCASRYYDKHADGLVQPWIAETVWLNPPYCKSGAASNQELWTMKLIAEYEVGNVRQAIVLVNAATETRWFQRLYAYPICFVRGRIHFNSPSGITTGPTVGSAFVYFGLKCDQFIDVFSQFGVVVKSVTPSKEAEALVQDALNF